MRSHSWYGLLLYLMAMISAHSAAASTCAVEVSDRFYDLGALVGKTDYSATSLSGRKFILNVCGPVKTELWNIGDVNADLVGGFYRGEHGDVSIGQYNASLQVRLGQPLLVYEGGSPCPGSEKLRASTAIRFVCDPSVLSKGSPQFITQLPINDEISCSYFFEWRTPAACPTTRPSGAGGQIVAFIIILFITFLVYIIGAFMYHRYVLGLRGLSQLPALFTFPSTQGALEFVRTCWDQGLHILDLFKDRHTTSFPGNYQRGFEHLSRSEVDAEETLSERNPARNWDYDEQTPSYNHQPLPSTTVPGSVNAEEPHVGSNGESRIRLL